MVNHHQTTIWDTTCFCLRGESRACSWMPRNWWCTHVGSLSYVFPAFPNVRQCHYHMPFASSIWWRWNTIGLAWPKPLESEKNVWRLGKAESDLAKSFQDNTSLSGGVQVWQQWDPHHQNSGEGWQNCTRNLGRIPAVQGAACRNHICSSTSTPWEKGRWGRGNGEEGSPCGFISVCFDILLAWQVEAGFEGLNTNECPCQFVHFGVSDFLETFVYHMFLLKTTFVF